MFSIFKHRWIFISVSVALILVGIVCIAIHGLNLDIEFAGGTSITMDVGHPVDSEEILELTNQAVGFPATEVYVHSENPGEFTVRTKALSGAQSDAVLAIMVHRYDLAENFSDYLVTTYTPSYGQQISNEVWLAVGIAVVLMLVYIILRFEFLSGISAVIALIHDVLIMISVYAIFNVPVNSSFIAVVLTILGYSINNIVVVFGRIRENRKSDPKQTYADTVDTSVKQTMGRSVSTMLTTFVMVTVLYMMGLGSIREFALPLMIGILGGAYSSLFIVSPVWGMLKGLKEKSAK